MAGEPINFLDSASDRDRTRFAAALQFGVENALWSFEEATGNPDRVEPALASIHLTMLQLQGMSMACGHVRVATICRTICLLIEDAAANLLASLLAEIKALRRIVVAALQDNTGSQLCPNGV